MKGRNIMMKIKLNALRITVIAALLAMALGPFMVSSTAKVQPAPATKTDLTNEERTLSRFFADLSAYSKEVSELDKRPRLASADLEPLQRKSADLKGRLSGVQSSIAEIVRKLKAANEWERLDETLLTGITDARQKTFLQEVSARRLLETAAGNLSSRGGDISGSIENLRKKLTRGYRSNADTQFVLVRYEAPVPFGAKDSLGCYAGRAMLVAIKLVGGTPTNAAYDAVFHQCWPEGSVSPF
jgi:hypothetical protein